MAATPSTSAASPPTASRCSEGFWRRATACSISPRSCREPRERGCYYAIFLDMLDAYVEQRGLDLPDDPAARAVLADPPCVTAPMRHLDLAKEEIAAVIWATGYGVDFGWIDLPVSDAQGEPVHRGGITEGAGVLLPRPAMSVEIVFRLPVRRRRRCRRARRPYSPPAPLELPPRLARKNTARHVNRFTSAFWQIHASALPGHPGQSGSGSTP